MTTEVRPVGVSCQLQCSYCYETSLRDAQAVHKYDRKAVLAAIDKLDSPYSLFGGEALILNLTDLEELLKIAHDKWGYSGVQTNGTLITERHIELFTTYKTHIGISLDGPDELNDSRWAGTAEATKKLSARTHWAIKTLCERAADHPHLLPSIIVTLHAGNASQERFPRLVEWFRELDALGVKHMNLHIMELDHKADELYLPQDELADRLIDLWNLQDTFANLQFTKFREVLDLLQGDDSNVVCVWRGCDPLNTGAVNGIENDGAPSICSRNHKGGTNWLPAEGSGTPTNFIGHPGGRHYERQIALQMSPQEHGGCAECPFFLVCQGNCPGESEDGDWRKRSHYCRTYVRLFEEGARRLREQGIEPLNDWKHRKHLEDLLVLHWQAGGMISLHQLVKQYKECTAKGMVPVERGYHGDSNV